MKMEYPKVEPREMDFADAEQLNGTGNRTVKIFSGYNCGSTTYSLVMSLRDVQRYTHIDPASQRPLNVVHAQGIAKYLLKGLGFAARRTCEKANGPGEIPEALQIILDNMELGPYMSIPPLVTSFRDCKSNGQGIKVTPLTTIENGGDLACYQITVQDQTRFWVVDGQHRREGLRLVQQFLDDIRSYHRFPAQPKLHKGTTRNVMSPEEHAAWQLIHDEMEKCKVTIEVHLGLNNIQEKQLFHDLNNLGMAVKKHEARAMDSTNPVVRFTREHLEEDKLSDHVRGGKIGWDDKGYSSDDLVAVNSVLLINKTRETGARNSEVEPRFQSADELWTALIKAGGLRSENARQDTVLAQPVVMKAIAKLWYDFNWGRKTAWNTPEFQTQLAEGIAKINFSHTNEMWQYYLLDSDAREAKYPELKDYLPDNGGGTRDLGTFDGNYFRFGIKHNDIYPIIGDMIRCVLKLPSRHVAELVAA